MVSLAQSMAHGFPRRLRRSKTRFFWQSLVTATLMLAGRQGPTAAAEKVFFKVGPLVRSLQVESLETFAETGTVNDDLAFYFDVAAVNAEQQEAFRTLLQSSAAVDGVTLSRFFYTDIGEELLTEFGQLIQTRAGLNGKSTLRAGLILAALEPEGLSPLGFLQALPTDVQIDVNDVRELESRVELLVTATREAVATIRDVSMAEADTTAIDYSRLPQLSQPGPFQVQVRRLELTDDSRDRTFSLDLYQPQVGTRPIPVIVFSHGLASSPDTYRQRAQHLASYGYLVAMPQHPGSDSQLVENFRLGLSPDFFQASEFIDRPRDISYVLDELERRNPREFSGRLQLDQVGVAGHSLGGYTALAVAGAQIDFDYLRQECAQPYAFLNISLLLQCQALQLPPQASNFRDPRVTAIALMNPVNSSVFGPSGLAAVQIPVVVGAGSHDPATPAVLEQFRSFDWFTTPNRALFLIEGQAHVNLAELDAGISQLIDSVPGLTLASPDLIDTYANAVATAFFELYLRDIPAYQAYFRPAYAEYLSQNEPFKMYMISAISDRLLIEALQDELERIQGDPPPASAPTEDPAATP